MDRVVTKCQTEVGAEVDVTDEDRVLVLMERSDKDIVFTRLRCPLCKTIEVHPVEIDEEFEFDVAIEFATGPYTDFETYTVTRDPSIFSIELKHGVLNHNKALPIIDAIRDLTTPPTELIDLTEEY